MMHYAMLAREVMLYNRNCSSRKASYAMTWIYSIKTFVIDDYVTIVLQMLPMEQHSCKKK